IRAVPEGGPAGSNVATKLPFTFYDHFTPAASHGIDRRQPLPSVFAARWAQGGGPRFSTNYLIWRGGTTGPRSTSCAVAVNSAMTMTEITRFDEHENSNTIDPVCIIPECNWWLTPATLPEASSTPTTSTIFPGLTSSGDLAGWFYLNLNNEKSPSRAS